MKTLVIAAAAALLAAPVVAQQYQGDVSPAEFTVAHFAQDHETGDGPRAVPTISNNGEILSTSNRDLASFAAVKLANGPEDER